MIVLWMVCVWLQAPVHPAHALECEEEEKGAANTDVSV